MIVLKHETLESTFKLIEITMAEIENKTYLT